MKLDSFDTLLVIIFILAVFINFVPKCGKKPKPDITVSKIEPTELPEPKLKEEAKPTIIPKPVVKPKPEPSTSNIEPRILPKPKRKQTAKSKTKPKSPVKPRVKSTPPPPTKPIPNYYPPTEEEPIETSESDFDLATSKEPIETTETNNYTSRDDNRRRESVKDFTQSTINQPFETSNFLIKEGDPAPNFTIKDIFTKNQYNYYKDIKGKKIVLINFWATWCAICKRTLPILANVYNKYEAQDIFFLGVLLPSSENDINIFNNLNKKYPIPYPVFSDTEFVLSTMIFKLEGMIPETIIIDKSGTIRFIKTGELEEDEIDFVIKGLLEEEKEAE